MHRAKFQKNSFSQSEHCISLKISYVVSTSIVRNFTPNNHNNQLHNCTMFSIQRPCRCMENKIHFPLIRPRKIQCIQNSNVGNILANSIVTSYTKSTGTIIMYTHTGARTNLSICFNKSARTL